MEAELSRLNMFSMADTRQPNIQIELSSPRSRSIGDVKVKRRASPNTKPLLTVFNKILVTIAKQTDVYVHHFSGVFNSATRNMEIYVMGEGLAALDLNF